MNRTEAQPLKAELTLGLQKFYSKEKNSLEDVAGALATGQEELYSSHDIKLSTKVTPCKIIFSGQNEDSVTLSFINYPKFPLSADQFEAGVEFIAEKLMYALSQNRIVIEYPHKTVMFEESSEIDPEIRFG